MSEVKIGLGASKLREVRMLFFSFAHTNSCVGVTGARTKWGKMLPLFSMTQKIFYNTQQTFENPRLETPAALIISIKAANTALLASHNWGFQ